jgi:allophanate hydrolase
LFNIAATFLATKQIIMPSLRSFPVMPKHTSNSISNPVQVPYTWDGDLSIGALAKAYREGLSPINVVEELYRKIQGYNKVDPAVWIYLLPEDVMLAAAKRLIAMFPDLTNLPPLFGVPFSLKDSINVAGIPTTTACPPLAFIPSQSAASYNKLIEQGALLVGKTNLDQLATGLSGVRSPYGIPKSVFNADYISGGSSSGSAVCVGAGLCSFSLATDTAGSGRVPAAFNGVVGFKPTKGTISFEGVTPACLSLDTVSLMALNVSDARTVWEICKGYDENDSHAKTTLPLISNASSLGPETGAFTFGIPPVKALSVCSPVYRRLFNEAVVKLQRMGGVLVDTEWTPFYKGGQLLYDGTFVSERLASLPPGWLEKHRADLHPVILTIFENVLARNSTAVEAYRDLHDKAL